MRDEDEHDATREDETAGDDRHEVVDGVGDGERGDAPPDPDDDAFPSLDELIGTFFSEASLLPIVVVVLGSGGAFGAALLVMTVVDRNPFAMGALVLLAGMTVDISLRARKEVGMRNLALLIGLVWAASVALALLAAWTGLAFG